MIPNRPPGLQPGHLSKGLVEKLSECRLQPVDGLCVCALIGFCLRGIITFEECSQIWHRHLGLARVDRIDAQIDIGEGRPRTGARLAQPQNIGAPEENPLPTCEFARPRLDAGRHDPKYQSLEPRIAIIDAGCPGLCFVHQLLEQRRNQICTAPSRYGPTLVVHWWYKLMKRVAT